MLLLDASMMVPVEWEDEQEQTMTVQQILTQHVEPDRDNDQLHATKDICNFGSGRLRKLT
jgi:hypothetical protein